MFAEVCQWKKPGQARGGENVRVRLLCIYFIFIVVLNVPSSAHMSVIKQSTSVHTTVNSQSSNSQHQFTLLSIHSHQTVNISSHCCQFTVIKQSTSIRNVATAFIKQPTSIHNVTTAFIKQTTSVHDVANMFIKQSTSIHNVATAFIKQPKSVHNVAIAFIKQLTSIDNATAFIKQPTSTYTASIDSHKKKKKKTHTHCPFTVLPLFQYVRKL